MRPAILLDKSYLQAASASTVRELSKSHELLMADVLFFEMISTGEPARTRCFSKLPGGENPITLVKNVGALLRKEIRTHNPAGKPSENQETFRFQFHPQLVKGTYAFDAQARAALEESNDELKQDVSDLIDTTSQVPRFFPDLLKGSDQERREARQSAEEFIANEVQQIADFLKRLKAPPTQRSLHSADINSSWAVFRWFQVKMLFSIDLFIRYSGNIPHPLTNNVYQRLEHDVLDSHYLILGVLEGAFATREKKLIRMFKLLRPDGILFS
jgi:hypothetical protein